MQRALQVLLVAGAIVLGRWPRRSSPLQLAAFTGALLVGFEAVLTHWFYLYLPWFFPFVAFTLLAPRRTEQRADDQDHAPPDVTVGLGSSACRHADGSQLVARPSPPHSTSAPSMRTSPLAGSSRTGSPVTKRRIAPSARCRSPSRADRSCRRR